MTVAENLAQPLEPSAVHTPEAWTGFEVTNIDGTMHMFSAGTQLSSGSSALQQEYLKIRYEFVQLMGWLPEAVSDTDFYDDDPATDYVIRTGDSTPGEVYSGARYTRVHDVESSLTWHMMDGNPAMQEGIKANKASYKRLEQAAQEGVLWDLTRLVPAVDGRIPKEEFRNSIVDLFAGGIVATHNPNAKPVWFFLASEKMKSFLDHLDIPNTAVVAHKVSNEDSEESYFCIVEPPMAVQHLSQSESLRGQRTYNRLVRTMESFNH